MAMTPVFWAKDLHRLVFLSLKTLSLLLLILPTHSLTRQDYAVISIQQDEFFSRFSTCCFLAPRKTNVVVQTDSIIRKGFTVEDIEKFLDVIKGQIGDGVLVQNGTPY
jgi:hypothetical protein